MITCWDIITIGNLSRNRYWGESDDRPRRSPLCTSTLISGEGFRLLVDPPIADPAAMAAELDRRTGLKLSDVDAVFVTHEHGDHHAGLTVFADARWLAAPRVAEALNASAAHQKRIEPAAGKIFDEIEVLPTPGHTAGHHSLRFRTGEGLSVIAAGDAVMTLDFWRDRRGFFNSADFEQASATMDGLSRLAEIIIPGHDNYFLASSL